MDDDVLNSTSGFLLHVTSTLLPWKCHRSDQMCADQAIQPCSEFNLRKVQVLSQDGGQSIDSLRKVRPQKLIQRLFPRHLPGDLHLLWVAYRDEGMTHLIFVHREHLSQEEPAV